MNRKVKQGFTLIELLVVVLIIGILAAMAVPQYQVAVEKSRMSEALLTMSDIQKGIDMYLLEHGWPNARMGIVGCEDAEDGKCNVLDIDVESGLDCHDGTCYSKHYSYEAYYQTDPDLFFVTAERDGIIKLDMEKWKERDEWDLSYDPIDNNDLGTKLGKSLETQGWRNEC